jgi:hypothetical protein
MTVNHVAANPNISIDTAYHIIPDALEYCRVSVRLVPKQLGSVEQKVLQMGFFSLSCNTD